MILTGETEVLRRNVNSICIMEYFAAFGCPILHGKEIMKFLFCC